MNAVVQFKLGALRHERGEVTAAALQQLQDNLARQLNI